eukprot:3518775-Amphidinium_carterae.1
MATKAYVDEEIRALKLEREALVAELAVVRSSMEASISDAVEGAVRMVMDTIEKEKAEVQAQMNTMATRDELVDHFIQHEIERVTIAEMAEQMWETEVETVLAVAQLTSLTSEHHTLQAQVRHAIAELSVVRVRLDESDAMQAQRHEEVAPMLKERAKVQEEKMANNPFQIRLEDLKPELRLKLQAQRHDVVALMLEEREK